MNISSSMSGIYGNVTPPAAGDVQDPVAGATADLEEKLAQKKSQLDSYKSVEKQCDVDTSKMLKKLNSMAREDNRLKAIEPKLRFAAPSIFAIGLGVAISNPIVAASAGAVFLGAAAAKLYIHKRIPKLDQEFWPLKQKYEQSFQDLQNMHITRETLEKQVSDLEARISSAHNQAVETKDMADRVAAEQPSGAGEIINDDEFLDIGGMRMKKRSDKEQAVFDLVQSRIRFKQGE